MDTYEKKYKEALERAKGIHSFSSDIAEIKRMEQIFPELAESENERIRKALILHIAKISTEIPVGALHRINGVDIPDILSWLEKQVEQNPDDIIESKFKIGDFIVNDYCFGKVIEITNDAYLLDTGQGIPFSCEHNAHLWTIEDAKDGDVLVASDGSLFIFAKVKDNSAYYHFSLCKNGSMEISDGKHAWETANSCHPANKEQRDLLFQKMREAGYKWDEKNKELRKIEQVSAWSEEDETVLNNLIYALANDRIGNDRDEYISWLKSLKQRPQ